MTQEEKQLLIKDLCARLPYRFFVHRYGDNATDIRIDNISTFGHFLEYSEGEDFKPYLRPMSSMTDEEKDEYDRLVMCNASWVVDDWLNAHYFDYRGLIPKGLAIESPEGIYNVKSS